MQSSLPGPAGRLKYITTRCPRVPWPRPATNERAIFQTYSLAGRDDPRWAQLPALGLENNDRSEYWNALLERALAAQSDTHSSAGAPDPTVFSLASFRKVLEFQHNAGLECSGCVTPSTWAALLGHNEMLRSEVLDPLQWHGPYKQRVDAASGRLIHESPWDTLHELAVSSTSLFWVGRLQSMLLAAGHQLEERELAVCCLGPSTWAALLAFQEAAPGLEASGSLDSATWACLSAAVQARQAAGAAGLAPDSFGVGSVGGQQQEEGEAEGWAAGEEEEEQPQQWQQASSLEGGGEDGSQPDYAAGPGEEEQQQQQQQQPTSAALSGGERDPGAAQGAASGHLGGVGNGASGSHSCGQNTTESDILDLIELEAEMHALRMQRQQLRLQHALVEQQLQARLRQQHSSQAALPLRAHPYTLHKRVLREQLQVQREMVWQDVEWQRQRREEGQQEVHQQGEWQQEGQQQGEWQQEGQQQGECQQEGHQQEEWHQEEWQHEGQQQEEWQHEGQQQEEWQQEGQQQEEWQHSDEQQAGKEPGKEAFSDLAWCALNNPNLPQPGWSDSHLSPTNPIDLPAMPAVTGHSSSATPAAWEVEQATQWPASHPLDSWPEEVEDPDVSVGPEDTLGALDSWPDNSYTQHSQQQQQQQQQQQEASHGAHSHQGLQFPTCSTLPESWQCNSDNAAMEVEAEDAATLAWDHSFDQVAHAPRFDSAQAEVWTQPQPQPQEQLLVGAARKLRLLQLQHAHLYVGAEQQEPYRQAAARPHSEDEEGWDMSYAGCWLERLLPQRLTAPVLAQLPAALPTGSSSSSYTHGAPSQLLTVQQQLQSQRGQAVAAHNSVPITVQVGGLLATSTASPRHSAAAAAAPRAQWQLAAVGGGCSVVESGPLLEWEQSSSGRAVAVTERPTTPQATRAAWPGSSAGRVLDAPEESQDPNWPVWNTCLPALGLDNQGSNTSFWPDLLHIALQRKGYFPSGLEFHNTAFGAGSYAAVVAFQAEQGLEASGVADGPTWAALLRSERELQQAAFAALFS